MTHLVPYPPVSGGAYVSSQILEVLIQLGQVDVCAFTPGWRRTEIERLKKVASRCFVLPLRRRPPLHWFQTILKRKPYYVFRDHSPEMAKIIQKLSATSYDAVVVDSLAMTPYVDFLKMPCIIQEHNIEWYLVKSFSQLRGPIWRLVGGIESEILRRYELRSCSMCRAVVVLSESDRERLRTNGVQTRIEVIPPSVNIVERRPRAEHRILLHVGTGHWPPIADGIRWFLRSVFPRIRRSVPDVKLWLAGPPPRNFEEKIVPEGVRILGFVEDLEPLYEQAAAFVVPLRVESGIRIKVLHALARGLAVVSTSAGCEGIGLVDGVHGRVADSAEDFAEAAISVLRDEKLRERLGEAGRSLVQERFNREVQRTRWIRLIQEVASGR